MRRAMNSVPETRSVATRLPAHLVEIRVWSERPEPPLTRQQAARVLGLHPCTIDRWARRGRLQRIDLGGTVRFPAPDMRRLQSFSPWQRFDDPGA